MSTTETEKLFESKVPTLLSCMAIKVIESRLSTTLTEYPDSTAFSDFCQLVTVSRRSNNVAKALVPPSLWKRPTGGGIGWEMLHLLALEGETGIQLSHAYGVYLSIFVIASSVIRTPNDEIIQDLVELQNTIKNDELVTEIDRQIINQKVAFWKSTRPDQLLADAISAGTNSNIPQSWIHAIGVQGTDWDDAMISTMNNHLAV